MVTAEGSTGSKQSVDAGGGAAKCARVEYLSVSANTPSASASSADGASLSSAESRNWRYTVLRDESSERAREELGRSVRAQLIDAEPDARSLPSCFFYDDAGSLIYERITDSDEYYLTRCERAIFEQHGDAILDVALTASAASAAGPANGAGGGGADDSGGGGGGGGRAAALNLVELGAGDGRKTSVLLERAVRRNIAVRYVPMDISEKAMVRCAARLAESAVLRDAAAVGAFVFSGLVGDYFECLRHLLRADEREQQRPQSYFVMFIGSSVGNFDEHAALRFLRGVRAALRRGDHLLVGFDLRKSFHRMQAAYDDATGHTAAFNRNLLHRMNRELGADFDPLKFEHYAQYNVRQGAMESWLVATEDTKVHFDARAVGGGGGGAHGDARAASAGDEQQGACVSLTLRAWEAIHTEFSTKYTVPQVERMAADAGFARVVTQLHDDRRWFLDSLWQV